MFAYALGRTLQFLSTLALSVFFLAACGGGGGGGSQNIAQLTVNTDSVIVYRNQQATFNVLDNDSSSYSGDLTVTEYSQAVKGKLDYIGNGVFAYDADAGTFGDDSFSYTVSDGKNTRSGKVNLTLTRWEPSVMVNGGGRFNMFYQTIVTDKTGIVTTSWVELIDPPNNYYNYLSRQYIPGSGWQTIKHINPGTESISRPHLFVDSNNTVSALWNQDSSEDFDVYISNFDSLNNIWGKSVKLNSVTQLGLCTTIAIDSNDNITVLWSEGGFDNPQTLVARRFDGNPWSDQLDISNRDVTITTLSCQTKAAASGKVSTLWRQVSSGIYSIWLNQYNDPDGWSGPVKISETASFEDDSSYFDYDGMGNVFVIWHDYGNSSLWASRYDTNAKLDSPTQLASTGKISKLAGIFANDTGDAIAIWGETNAKSSDTYPYSPYDVYVARFNLATGWAKPVQLNSPDQGVYNLVAGKIGNRILLATLEGNGSPTIVIREYGFDTAWTAPQSISGQINKLMPFFTPKIAANSNGEATLVWPEYIYPEYRVWVARRDKSGNWSKAIPLNTGAIYENPPASDKTDINVVLDENGTATVIWTQNECADRYSPGKCWSLWSTRYQNN